jgi:hypothetical protein
MPHTFKLIAILLVLVDVLVFDVVAWKCKNYAQPIDS